MKKIKYTFGGKEKSITCDERYLRENYAIAQAEAVGEIIVEDTEQSPEERLAELHRQLAATDYIDNKIVEALMADGTDAAQAVADEYADTLAQRQAWRDEINELEAETGAGED